MNEANNIENQKVKIKKQVADLARLLGMIPSNDTITISEPVTQNSMSLANWLDDTRNSFLTLSILISKALDIQLQ